MGREEILDTLRSFMADNGSRYAIIRLGLFGSAARGELRE
mgnify:CR=1 FL=1